MSGNDCIARTTQLSQHRHGGATGRPDAVPALPDLPEATVARLPEYLRALHHLAEAGHDTVSSEGLAAAAGVNSAKLRKDLSHLGLVRHPGRRLRRRAADRPDRVRPRPDPAPGGRPGRRR